MFLLNDTHELLENVAGTRLCSRRPARLFHEGGMLFKKFCSLSSCARCFRISTVDGTQRLYCKTCRAILHFFVRGRRSITSYPDDLRPDGVFVARLNFLVWKEAEAFRRTLLLRSLGSHSAICDSRAVTGVPSASICSAAWRTFRPADK